MATITKQDLVNSIAASADGLTKQQAGAAVTSLVEAISRELASGGRVQIAGLGTFSVADRAARESRNPQTGETVHVPARKAPVFKASSRLKEAVNHS